MAGKIYLVDVIDVSSINYSERLTALSLQGLLNREGPIIYLDHGIHDDPFACLSTRACSPLYRCTPFCL